jgi:hypothetical protein
MATGTYSDGTTADLTPQVTWTSGSPAVAAISPTGLATGVGVGASPITAALNGVTSPAATLSVTPAVLTSLAVSPQSPSIGQVATKQFAATGTYSDGTTADLTPQVTWSSGTPAVATISPTGLATGLAPGTTGITATLGGVSSPSDPLAVSPATPTLSPVVVKDNGQAGYYEYGLWTSASGGFHGSVRTTGPGTISTNAQWVLQVPAGTYDFYVTWTASSSNTTAAPYSVYDNFTRLGAFSVNQQLVPADSQYGGVLWSKIGTFTVTNGRVVFALSAASAGNVVADGVLLAPRAIPTTTSSLVAATAPHFQASAQPIEASIAARSQAARAALIEAGLEALRADVDHDRERVLRVVAQHAIASAKHRPWSMF